MFSFLIDPRTELFEDCLSRLVEDELIRDELVEQELVKADLRKNRMKVDKTESLVSLDGLIRDELAQRLASAVSKELSKEDRKKFHDELSKECQKEPSKEPSNKPQVKPSGLIKKIPVRIAPKEPQNDAVKNVSDECAKLKARIVDLENANDNLKEENRKLDEKIASFMECLDNFSKILIDHSKDIDTLKKSTVVSQKIHKRTEEELSEIIDEMNNMKLIEGKLMTSIDKAISIFESLH